MAFEEILHQVLEMLQRRGRVSYRALKRQFTLDDEYLEDLKAEIVDVLQLAVEQDGAMLVWLGKPSAAVISAEAHARQPLSYTPTHLTEKILLSKAALEGERKQVMGDGIMALFGAPIAHEDHAVRACYATLRMQESVNRYGDEVQRTLEAIKGLLLRESQVQPPLVPRSGYWARLKRGVGH